MARLWQSGCESNTTTVKEWDSVLGAGSTVQTTTVRTGTYAAKMTSLSSGTTQGLAQQFTAAANGPFFVRFYFNATTLPSAENTVFAIATSTTINTATMAASISVDNTGAFRLYNATTLIGSASSTVSTNTWHSLEMWYDKSPAGGSQILKARLDGTQFAAATNLTIANQAFSVIFGANLKAEAQTTGTWFFDDIAVNDGTGSSQTSYPGAGGIVHMTPTGAGDNTTWAIFAGTTNWDAVGNAGVTTPANSEVTPDGNTSAVQSLTAGQLDDYALTVHASIGATDTISAVAVGVYYEGVAASANSQFKLRLKVAGGTADESVAIDPTSTGYVTNNKTAPRNFQMVRYFRQDGTTVWTQSTLGTAQIGLNLSTASTARARISTVWLSVDFTPTTATQTVDMWQPPTEQPYFDKTGIVGY